MKDKLLSKMQAFSKAIIVPVLFLPIAGLLLAVSSILKNPSIVAKGGFLFNIGQFMSGSLWPIINNLSIIFCIGIAIGIAKKKKAEAGLVALLVYFVFLGANSTWLSLAKKAIAYKTTADLYGTGQTVQLGFQITDMGVFLGIILGCIIGAIHNKYVEVELKGGLALYGNSKLVFLILTPIVALFGISITYIWPYVASVIKASSNFMSASGPIGVFVYGFLNKFLIPTGLHHLVWSPFKYTSFGGQMMINGQTYYGAYPIFVALLSDPNVKVMDESSRFLMYGMSKIFGLLGAAFAMYRTARLEKKVSVKALIIPATATAFLVGITEPLEFTFLFVAPVLWFANAFLDGLFQMIAYIAGARVCAADGIINFIVYNIPAGIAKTRWPIFVLIGLVEIFVYYFVFKFLIEKFNYKTPGRDDSEEVKLYTKKDYQEKTQDVDAVRTTEKTQGAELANIIIDALGGKENIETVDNCYTRLRVTVKDIDIVDESTLKQTGSSGVVKKGNNVQVIYGLNVSKIRGIVDEELGL